MAVGRRRVGGLAPARGTRLAGTLALQGPPGAIALEGGCPQPPRAAAPAGGIRSVLPKSGVNSSEHGGSRNRGFPGPAGYTSATHGRPLPNEEA